jgi:hypothetical protein
VVLLMFIKTQLAVILGPALLAWVIIYCVVTFRRRRAKADPVQRAWSEFRLSTIGTGVILLLLWFALPQTPILSTFGYPADLASISQPQNLLKYLQDYNIALVRTTEVVHWLLFIFVWWFLAAIYSFSKNMGLSAIPREISH